MAVGEHRDALGAVTGGELPEDPAHVRLRAADTAREEGQEREADAHGGDTILPPIATPLTQQIRSAPPSVHGDGNAYFGLAWAALEWLERELGPEMTTLETGSGASSIVFAASGAKHTVISPASGEHERIRAWCVEAGVSTERVTFLAESSDVALTGGWTPEPLDLALLDGAHLFPFPALDWFLTAKHLKVGGRVVLDDAYLPSVAMVVRFLRDSPSWEFEGPISYRTVCFRKLDDEVGYDSIGTRFDRFPRYGYLPPAQRAAAYARHFLIDRSPLGQRLVGRLRRR